jgi:predicted O-methyltransferase YrrM
LENLLITSVFWMILFVTLLVRRFVWQAKMADKIDVRWGKAQDAIPQLNSGSLFSKPVDGIDFLFLDAKPSEYLDYLLAAEPLLNPGAVVVADNAGIFSKSLTEYLNYVRGSGRYESEYIESTLEYRDEVPDGLEVSRYIVQS